MKELKKEFRWFNIMEYEKEENYLSKRHQEGWKFKRVTFPGVYTFEAGYADCKKSPANDRIFPGSATPDHFHTGNLYRNLIGGKT